MHHIPSAINHGFLSLWIVRNEMSDNKKKWANGALFFEYNIIQLLKLHWLTL